jgi:hypothetical protein
MLYKRKNKAEAITQILILIIATFAIAWMIGSEVEEVSAADDGGTTTTTTTNPCIGSYCSASALYPGKLMGEKCVADMSKPPTQTCQYGCTTGAASCDFKQNPINWENIITTGITTGGVVAAALINGAAGGAAGGAAVGAVGASVGAGATAGVGAVGTTTYTYGGMALAQASTVGVSSLSGILYIAAWAAVAFVVGRYVGQLFGLSVHNSQSLGYSLAVGVVGAMVAGKIIGAAGALGGPVGLAIGAAVAFITFVLLAKKSSADIITYNCYQWDSKSGAGLSETQMRQRCRLCDSQKDFVCTEYQCRSLGQGCMLIDDVEGDGKQACIWNNTNDILAPVISPWKEALLEDFAYTPDPTVVTPDKGVKITYTGTAQVTKDGTTRCAPPYTKVSFGVELDEPAKCKISPLRLKNYSIMADVFMGDGIRDYNHSFALSMPSKGALIAENFTVDNGGKYEYFVRCQDSNGNTNIGTFVFKFCISQGPDTTPPRIEGTSLFDNQPLSYGQKFTDIELYVNEPAECKWSHTDKEFETMEQNLTCAKNISEMNAQMLYTCRGNLTGIKDGQDNTFYFRCKDQPYLNATEQNKRNANTESYTLTLIGTEPLAIVDLGPHGIIKGPTNMVVVNLTVETERGYDEGKAICAFSETGTSGSYIDFFYGYDAEPFTQTTHSQELGLTAQNYTYFIKCRDKGGNTDEANVSFAVEVDISPPIVVRVYKEDEYLKLITDEPGKCVYSNSGCDYLFSEGTEMTSLDETEHYVEWDISKDFYIKCQDVYQKSPPPKECSIVARPFEIFELQ